MKEHTIYHKINNQYFAFLIAALLFLVSTEGLAQSATDLLNQMSGYSDLNVPPPSEPVCAICRIPMRGVVRPWDHRSWCDCYRPAPETQTRPQSDSRTVDYNADERSNYARVTYPPQQVEVYVPPTPIRDTPEGQALLSVSEQLGYAVGNMVFEGFRNLFARKFEKTYETAHREYHSSAPEKGWGSTQVVKENGKEGVWDNATHKWLVNPGKFDEFLLLDGYCCAARKNGKWGVIDATEKGRELVSCTFDEVLFYTRGGTGSPIGLAVRDQGGNMHWIIGRIVLQNGTFSFVPYEGEWCSVDFSFKPIPDDDEIMVIVAKDAKTGKTKVLDYSTKTIFGRFDEQYENVFLTNMVESKSVGNVDTWYDFYRVENNGKMGFVVSQSAADYKRRYDSYELLPCEYDEITPMTNVIGWKEAARWGSSVFSYKGKELVIAEKDGHFGVGTPSSFKNEQKLPYKEASVMRIPFGTTKFPVIMCVKPDGCYVPTHPDGSKLWWHKPDGYTEDGRQKLLYTIVEGYDLAEVMDEIQQQFRANPKNWNLTDDEIKILLSTPQKDSISDGETRSPQTDSSPRKRR